MTHSFTWTGREAHYDNVAYNDLATTKQLVKQIFRHP